MLKRTEHLCISFTVLLSAGIFDSNNLFTHYFINYDEVFNSKIGTHAMH